MNADARKKSYNRRSKNYCLKLSDDTHKPIDANMFGCDEKSNQTILNV